MHCDLAVSCDIPKENTFILENGDVLKLTKNKIIRGEKIQAGDIYVDGSRVGDVGNIVIKDRNLMSTNGIMAIIANIDFENKKLLSIPMVSTRGYILVNENEVLIKQVEKNAERIIATKLKDKNVTYNDIKNEIINGLMPFLLKATGRVPIILPIIMDIKNYNK